MLPDGWGMLTGGVCHNMYGCMCRDGGVCLLVWDAGRSWLGGVLRWRDGLETGCMEVLNTPASACLCQACSGAESPAGSVDVLLLD